MLGIKSTVSRMNIFFFLMDLSVDVTRQGISELEDRSTEFSSELNKINQQNEYN